jgi:hypothetical protein
VQAEAKLYADSRQPALDAANAAVQKARADKAPADEVLAKATKAGQLAEEVNVEVQRRANASVIKIRNAEKRLAADLLAERNLDAIAYIGDAMYVKPNLDLTDQLAKLYDKQAGAASVGEVQELRAEISALKTKQASPPLAKK